jgi:MSHA biogenesis protein MshJ
MTLTKIEEKIDNLSIRERAIILFGILFVLYSVWDVVLMQPLNNQQKIVKADLQQMQATQMATYTQIQKTLEDNRKDPNIELEQQLNALKAELKQLNDEVQASTASLVTPRQMAKILEEVLHKTRGLRLTAMKSLGATSLTSAGQGKKTAGAAKEEGPAGQEIASAYKHGIRIEFEGDYMSTLDYLKELEVLDSRFFWDSIEFQVKDYPLSRAAIQVFTLSLQINWIDV